MQVDFLSKNKTKFEKKSKIAPQYSLVDTNDF